jgi:hypothetical protein
MAQAAERERLLADRHGASHEAVLGRVEAAASAHAQALQEHRASVDEAAGVAQLQTEVVLAAVREEVAGLARKKEALRAEVQQVSRRRSRRATGSMQRGPATHALHAPWPSQAAVLPSSLTQQPVYRCRAA